MGVGVILPRTFGSFTKNEKNPKFHTGWFTTAFNA
jgi:hypothetical protein